MRYSFSILILGSIAALGGYELRRGWMAPADYRLVDTDSGSSSERQLPGQASPRVSPSISFEKLDRIRKQETLVSDLKKKSEEQSTSLDKLNQQINQQSLKESTPDRNQEEAYAVRSDLQDLYQQRNRQADLDEQAKVYEEVQNRSRQLDRDLRVSQVRDQLAREQRRLENIHQQLRELNWINIPTDTLAALKVRNEEQQQRVSELETQYRDTLLASTADQVEDQANLRRTLGGQAAAQEAVDDKIARNEQRLAQLDKQSAAGQSAGSASSEALREKYMEQKRAHEETRTELDEQTRVLAQLTGKPVASGQ